MARRPNTIAQRIALDGGEEIRKELERLGFAGQEAFKRLQAEASKVRGPDPAFERRLKQLEKTLERAGRNFQRVGRQFQQVGRNLTAFVTAPIVAAAAGSIKAFGDFEQALGNVETLVDRNVESFEGLRDGVLAVSREVEVVPLADLTAALYDVRSAGVAAADQFDVLAGSAKLGVAGLGSTAAAVDLVTSAINSFGLEGAEQNAIYNQLFTTVKRGKTTIDALSTGFGAAAPVIASAGVEVDEFLSAVAAMTTTGAPANQALTQLRAVIAGLTRETALSAEVFGKLGVKTFKELIRESGGLVPALERINRVLGGNDAEIIKLVGSVEAYNAVLSLTGKQNDAFNETLADMRSGVDAVNAAFEIQREKVNRQFIALKNDINEIAIIIGEDLVPLFREAADHVKALAERFKELEPETRRTIEMWVGIAAAIGPVIIVLGVLISSLGRVAQALRLVTVGLRLLTVAALTNPFTAAAAAIGIAVGALILLASRQDDASEAAVAHRQAMAALDEAVKAVKDGVPGATQAFGDLAEAQLNSAKAAVENARAIYEEAAAARDARLEVAKSIPGPFGAAEALLTQEAQNAERAWANALARLGEIEGRIAEGREAIGAAAAEPAKVLTEATNKAGDAVDGLDDKVEKLGRTIRILGPGGVIREVAIGAAAQKAGEDVDGLGDKAEEAGRKIKVHLGGDVREVAITPALERAGEAADAAGEAAGRAQTPAEQLAQKIAAARETIGEFRTEASAALAAVVAKAGEARDALGEVEAPALDWSELDAEAARVLGGIVTAAELSVGEIEAQFVALPPAVAAALAPLKIEATGALAEVAFGATETVARLGEIAPPQLDWSGFTDAATAAFDGIVAAAAGAVSAITARFQTLPSALAGAAEEAEGGAGEAAGGGVWSRIVADAQSALAQLVALVGALPGQLAPYWQQIAAAARAMFDGLDDFVDGVMASVKSSIEAVASEIERIADQLVAAMKRVEAAAKSALAAAKAAQSSSGGDGPAFARGGHVRGAGTSTSDSIPAWLSTGEFVLRSAAVRKYGLAFLERLNAMRIDPPKFSAGGIVARLDHAARSFAPISRATGGAVPALADGPGGGGTPPDFGRLVLSAGNEILEVFTDEGTADRLMRFTTRQRVRRAGRPLSWDRG